MTFIHIKVLRQDTIFLKVNSSIFKREKKRERERKPESGHWLKYLNHQGTWMSKQHQMESDLSGIESLDLFLIKMFSLPAESARPTS